MIGNVVPLERRRALMALARWTPARDIPSIRDEMNRLVNEFLGRGAGEEGTWSSGAWMPPVDIYESDEALVVKAELPGFSKEDIAVELKDNTLMLRGERKREAEMQEGNYHRMERTYGVFQRSFVLPTTVDQQKVKATYKDGVLELTLPKVEAAKPRRVAISS
jgi:HSP20 family protein